MTTVALEASGGEFPPNSVSISLKLSTGTACLLLVLWTADNW